MGALVLFGIWGMVLAMDLNLEQNRTVDCPYCGEAIGLVLDCTIASQEFVEDCQVCCRPIQYVVRLDERGELLELRAGCEDDS